MIPARKQEGYQNYHSIYRRKVDSWTQTNIQEHINAVKNSGRINEIIAMKIWTKRHNLDFPSIYLELIVLEALKYKSKDINNLASNITTILDYLIVDFFDKRIIDPSNSNNIISNDLTFQEKKMIVNQAKNSRAQQYWRDVIW